MWSISSLELRKDWRNFTRTGRLVKYAAKRFLEIGIEVSNFEIEVEMVEHGCKVYHVTFKNGKGASFILNQIYVYRGWPSFDYWFELREED